jgi:hypothetical protein
MGADAKSYMRKGFLIYMRKCANIQPYKRRPLDIYDFATAPIWISLYMRKILFSFLSVQGQSHKERTRFKIDFSANLQYL